MTTTTVAPVPAPVAPGTIDPATRPYIVSPGHGVDTPVGHLACIHIVPEAVTQGRLSIVEHTLPPRHLAAPLHRHSREDELSIVLSTLRS